MVHTPSRFIRAYAVQISLQCIVFAVYLNETHHQGD